MIKLDNDLLNELGLAALPEDQKRAMFQHIYETLELRVGTQLANQMTDQQLEEFEQFIDSGGDANQAQALQWLETNLPNYKEVVNQVFEQLKGEVKQMAPQIMASQQAAAQMPPQAPQPGMLPGQPAPQPQQLGQPMQPQFAQPQQYPPSMMPPQGQPQPMGQMPAQPYGPQPGPAAFQQSSYQPPAPQPGQFGGPQPQQYQPPMPPVQQPAYQPPMPPQQSQPVDDQSQSSTQPTDAGTPLQFSQPQPPQPPQSPFPAQQPPAGPSQQD